jgi:hypothetical protein
MGLPRLFQKAGAVRDIDVVMARDHDHLQPRKLFARERRKLQARFLAGEFDVGHQHSEFETDARQYKFCSFDTVALHDIHLFVPQKHGQQFAL